MESVIENIKRIRKERGYSHEYIANELNISQVAYSKLEKNVTKLTVKRLYNLADILEVQVFELLELKWTNQINKENDTTYLQQITNLYNENKEQNLKIKELYEARLQEKDNLIIQLKKFLNND